MTRDEWALFYRIARRRLKHCNWPREWFVGRAQTEQERQVFRLMFRTDPRPRSRTTALRPHRPRLTA